MELAKKNAQLVLSTDKERLKREEGRTIGAVKEIEKWLGIASVKRIEALIYPTQMDLIPLVL